MKFEDFGLVPPTVREPFFLIPTNTLNPLWLEEEFLEQWETSTEYTVAAI